MEILKRAGLVAVLFWIGPVSAQAAGGGGSGNYYLGLESGVAFLNSGAGTRFNLGFGGGGRVAVPNLLVGAYYSYIPFGSVSSPSGISVSGSEKFYGLEGRWDFTPLLTGFSAGIRAGLSSVSTQSFVPGALSKSGADTYDDQSANGFAWGPIIEYERPISSSFTFGGEAYLMLPSELAANNVFGALVNLKFWF